MELYLVKYKKRVDFESSEFTFYVVAAENKYAAMRYIDSIYKMGTGNLDAQGPIPKNKLYDEVKKPEILLEYEA